MCLACKAWLGYQAVGENMQLIGQLFAQTLTTVLLIKRSLSTLTLLGT